MKKIMIVMGLMIATNSFCQNSTQIEYYLQQIAAFQTYLGYVKKGYNLVGTGLSNVQRIKKGEWALHKDFFNSLTVVNPEIKKSWKLFEINTMQVKIIKRVKMLHSEIKRQPQLTLSDINYVINTCDHVLSECLRNMDDLIDVSTSGKLEMTDDERLKRIHRIYAGMQDNYEFLIRLGNSIMSIAKQRLLEKLDTALLARLRTKIEKHETFPNHCTSSRNSPDRKSCQCANAGNSTTHIKSRKTSSIKIDPVQYV